MAKVEAEFVFERSVKWSHLYKEDISGDFKNAKISQSLYVLKSAVGDKAPARIKVTVETI